MTRILQIRRGTTHDNDNFTGNPGEISFDTDAKTLRVHDGETLGGFALARADQTSGGDDGDMPGFDINAVPAEFWQNIIATYAAATTKIERSRASIISTGSYLEYIFDIDADAQFAQCVLVCQTPEAGYGIGDTVAAFGIGPSANPSPNTFKDENGLHVRLMVAGEEIWVSHKTDGNKINITNSKWKIQYAVWY